MKFTTGKTYKIKLHHSKCDTKKYPLLLHNELSFTFNELLHSIITCGMPSYYLTFPHSINRTSEILYKLHLLECALDEEIDSNDPTKTTGYLVPSKNLKYLDSSERAAISYYIGMFFTKLASKKIFDITYLIHLNIAQPTNAITFNSTDRPDLIGYNLHTKEYSVFEAKGRQKFNQKTIAKAYKQVCAINDINGHAPVLRAVGKTHFKKNILHLYIKDPVAEGELSITLPIETLLKQYYQPIYELMHENNLNTDKGDFLSTKIILPDNHHLIINMPEFIKNLFKKDNALETLNRFEEYLLQHNITSDFIEIKYE